MDDLQVLKLYLIYSGKMREDGFEKRQCSLHIAAWSIPFVLTTVLFVTNVIEADSLSGKKRQALWSIFSKLFNYFAT